MSVLNRILKTKQEEVTERKNRISERDLMSTLLAGRQRLSMRKALEESATGIIAEFKRKSPSGGFIHEAAGVQEVVGGYVRNGAAACSVLTDTDYFGGSLLDLAMARGTYARNKQLLDLHDNDGDPLTNVLRTARLHLWKNNQIYLEFCRTPHNVSKSVQSQSVAIIVPPRCW